jgi:hypothetical protein
LGPGLPSAEQPGVGSVVGQLSSDSIESFGCDPIQEGGAINNLVPQQQRVNNKQKGGKKKKKKNPKRNIPNLPYNMLRKLPGGLPTKKAGTSKKRDDGEEGLSDVAELSDIPQIDTEVSPSPVYVAESSGGFELEVVLPFNMEDVGHNSNPILDPVVPRIEAGTIAMSSSSVNVVPDPREVYEAEKLVQLGMEMGINFQGSEVEDVERMIAMEERDRLEKQEWENKRGDQ